MDTIMVFDRIGPALPCAPATVAPHGVAHPATVASCESGLRRRRPAALLVAGTTLRTGGDVSPVSGDEWGVVSAGPIFDDNKCTGASVPGRRGGT